MIDCSPKEKENGRRNKNSGKRTRNSSYCNHIGSRPFKYRNKNTQSKKAITAPHPSFILYPIKIIAITANITRTIREMNSKEKAGSSPIPNNPIYSKNIISP